MATGTYSPEHWRSRAKELRAMAAKTHDADVRANLLELAESYERIATMAEQNEPTSDPKNSEH